MRCYSILWCTYTFKSLLCCCILHSHCTLCSFCVPNDEVDGGPPSGGFAGEKVCRAKYIRRLAVYLPLAKSHDVSITLDDTIKQQNSAVQYSTVQCSAVQHSRSLCLEHCDKPGTTKYWQAVCSRGTRCSLMETIMYCCKVLHTCFGRRGSTKPGTQVLTNLACSECT